MDPSALWQLFLRSAETVVVLLSLAQGYFALQVIRLRHDRLRQRQKPPLQPSSPSSSGTATRSSFASPKEENDDLTP